MTIAEIQKICYVGAGTMGCFNSLVAAVNGYDVALYDLDPKTLEQLPARQLEMADMLVGGGYCERSAIAEAADRITVFTDLAEAAAGADLVSESVFEQLELKRKLHRELDQVCPEHTILTTNSSKLTVSEIEDVVRRGERFAALHSHLGSPLVDIVGGPRTLASVIDTLRRFVDSIGGVPLVLSKEYPGYVLNAMLGPLLSTSMLLVSEGLASHEEVDRAWMRERSAPMGPFGMIDLFGINLIHDSWQYRAQEDLFQTYRPAFLELLAPLLERGYLGIKAGRGFYRYPEPEYQRPGFAGEGGSAAGVYEALACALVGNALLVAQQGVASPADIDRAWTVGTYLEQGPFSLLAAIGAAEFKTMLTRQVELRHFDRQKAALALQYLEDGVSSVVRS